MRIKRLCNAKKGFSLIEVIIALAILMIVVLGLLTSYYSYYRNMTDLRIQTIGQNLAQLQLEDVQNLADTVLFSLVQGGEHSPNYPADTDPNSAIYKSGRMDGSFQIERLSKISLFDSDGSLHHFANGSETDTEGTGTGLGDLLVLPISIVVVPIDTDSDGINDHYTLTLHKEVFPNYEKEIMITDRTPGLSPAYKIFNIKITIFWHVNGVEKSITITGEKNDARSS